MRCYKIIASTVALMFSTGVNADLISHNGYTLNTDTNIVTGGGHEWLQWDHTVGLSVNDALAIHDGWRVATSVEVATLFNTFNFGITFDPLNMDYLLEPLNDSLALLNFIEIFGDSLQASGTAYPDNAYEKGVGVAFAGTGNGLYTGAILGYNDVDGAFGPVGSNSFTSLVDFLNADDNGGSRGIALVKVSAVPVPAAVWLFGSGLIGLTGLARRKKA